MCKDILWVDIVWCIKMRLGNRLWIELLFGHSFYRWICKFDWRAPKLFSLSQRILTSKSYVAIGSTHISNVHNFSFVMCVLATIMGLIFSGRRHKCKFRKKICLTVWYVVKASTISGISDISGHITNSCKKKLRSSILFLRSAQKRNLKIINVRLGKKIIRSKTPLSFRIKVKNNSN